MRAPLVHASFPEPQAGILAAWEQDLFESEELWAIEDEALFFSRLEDSGLKTQTFAMIRSRFKQALTFKEFLEIQPFYNWKGADGYVFMDGQVRSLIPEEILTQIYGYLVDTQRAPPHLRFADRAAATAHFARLGTAGIKGYDLDGRGYYVFFEREMWRSLSTDARLEFLHARYLTGHPAQQTQDVMLEVATAEQASALALRYAGDRDPRVLERFFLRAIRSDKSGVRTIPLSAVLPRSMRGSLNQYTTCSGMDCFNASVNAALSTPGVVRPLSRAREVLDLIKRDFVPLANDEKRRLGDLLLYQNETGAIVHASSYVDEDHVFVKNGAAKFNPFVLQNRSENERLYFPQGGFRLTAFRAKSATQCEPRLLKSFRANVQNWPLIPDK